MSLKYVTAVLQNVGFARLAGSEEGAWFEAPEGSTKETVQMLLKGFRRKLRGMSLKIQPKGSKLYVFAGAKGADKRVKMESDDAFKKMVMEGMKIIGFDDILHD